MVGLMLIMLLFWKMKDFADVSARRCGNGVPLGAKIKYW
jgi:hypothetical protein